MIERVARAICQAGDSACDPSDVAYLGGGKDGPLWQAYVPEAKAAIEAMREPTEAMAFTGGNVVVDEDMSIVGKDVWQAMIDAALKDT